ncbi:MAG TPA: hypothetical protein P5108_06740 [Marmoricola sp.]|nr:hypothetical protein [Marmoricola sp.]
MSMTVEQTDWCARAVENAAGEHSVVAANFSGSVVRQVMDVYPDMSSFVTSPELTGGTMGSSRRYVRAGLADMRLTRVLALGRNSR